MPTNLGHRVLPCLLVNDMQRSLDFYLDVLGFTQTGYYPIESDPIRTEVRRDDVAIVLYTESNHSSDQLPIFSGAFYFFPESIATLADELRGRVPFAWRGARGTLAGFAHYSIWRTFGAIPNSGRYKYSAPKAALPPGVYPSPC